MDLEGRPCCLLHRAGARPALGGRPCRLRLGLKGNTTNKVGQQKLNRQGKDSSIQSRRRGGGI